MIAALRLWREGLIGLLLLTIAGLWTARGEAEHRAELLRRDVADARTELDRTRQDVRAATELAREKDRARAAEAERDQQTISLEVQNAYSKQLADLRSRYDALRLRAAVSPADPGGGGGASVPVLSEAAGSPDAGAGQAGLPAEDALIASEQALRLKSLQDWVRGQEGVDRGDP